MFSGVKAPYRLARGHDATPSPYGLPASLAGAFPWQSGES